MPARLQNLLISPSKHLYCLSDGTLKYQQKPVDPRTLGRTHLTRLVLLDVDTRILYGEYHESDDVDLMGFLARAWSDKPQHLMRGLPGVLNVPRVVHETPSLSTDIAYVKSVTQIEVAALPSGFDAGIHALKQLEKEVIENGTRRSNPLSLPALQAASALLSTLASGTFAPIWKKAWGQVASLDPDMLAKFDACYEPYGAWRTEPFDTVLEGC